MIPAFPSTKAASNHIISFGRFSKCPKIKLEKLRLSVEKGVFIVPRYIREQLAWLCNCYNLKNIIEPIKELGGFGYCFPTLFPFSSLFPLLSKRLTLDSNAMQTTEAHAKSYKI